jgi:hypothetical protein
MKRLAIAFSMVLAFGFYGCEEETTKYIEVDRPPAIPQGVYSITGDGEVTVIWQPVQDNDLDYYNVWRSLNDTTYNYLDWTGDTIYVDTGVTNGVTYYYAVSAVDLAGNESDPSFKYFVPDTPRPEGSNVLLYDLNWDPDRSGFDFSTHSVVPYNSAMADIYLEYETVFRAPDTVADIFFINVANVMTDIQDMGYTRDFDEISYVPDTIIADTAAGWSEVGWVEAIFGHTYIIWTADNHFAKIRVYQVYEPTAIVFDWAYQEAVGNLELVRPQHNEDEYLRRTINGLIVK